LQKTLIGSVATELEPGYLSTDKKGRFLLVTYFWVGKAAVYPIGSDGVAANPPIEYFDTFRGVHSIQTDPSNKFVFLPHIAIVGPNLILQFKFDELTGRLIPNTPDRVIPEEGAGPRDYCFHPNLDIAYFCNEEGSSVTAYRFDRSGGTLTPIQTVSTVPDGYIQKNRCAEIQILPNGKALYVSNRGHNSLACFSIHQHSGLLTSLGHVPEEPETRAFCLDPDGNFLYAAGEKSGRLLSYSVNKETGGLTHIGTYAAGKAPWWMLITA
jgi:6-phosphogluconolactonase